MDYNKISITSKTYLLFTVIVLSFNTLTPQTKKQREAITSGYDKEILKSLILDFEDDYTLLLNKIGKTSKIYHKTYQEDGTLMQLSDFATDGTPLYYTTFNTSSSEVSRANTLHKNGLLNLNLDGLDMQVGIWDAGIALTTHQEFNGRAIDTDSNGAEVASHATMVTGTVISSGVKERAKGVAHKATAHSHDWIRDKIEVAEAAANGLLLSNHSYGINSSRVPNWFFGSYIKVSQDWDKIMYNAPYYLMVTAAGNSQRTKDNEAPNFGKSNDGFDLLLGFTTAKNGLVIAGADVKVDALGELKEASVSSYSSFGPIDDSRIKPDLAGDGGLIYSTNSNSNTSYDSLLGTSMATPSITGALLLLQEYYGELYGSYMKAATLKGLALHTADDVEELGPDYKMGWGVINAKRAAEVLKHKEYSTVVLEETLENGESFSITVEANNEEALMASISWTDPEGNFVNRGDLNDTTPALVNDLDIKITKNNTSYLPWKLNAANANANAIKGDNKVDPFERIDIADAEGTYTVRVSHKDTLTHKAQDFSLIITGVSLTKCELKAPSVITIVGSDENSTSWSWSAIEDALFEVQYKEKYASDWNTELTLKNGLTLGELEREKRYQIRLRSFCSQNLASAYSEIYEFDFKGSDTQIIEKEQTASTNKLEIKVFPNPAVSSISIANETSKEAVYIISTSSGNSIKRGSANAPIDVSSLQSGLYIISILDNTGIKSTKFFKN